MGQIEIDQIVAQQKVRAIGKIIQLGQRRGQAIARPRKDQRLTSIRAYRSKFVDATVLNADFKIQ